jgi:hypothetical protein
MTIKQINKGRILFLVGGIIGVTAITWFQFPAPIFAQLTQLAQSCSIAPDGLSCVNVRRNGLSVVEVYASRSKAGTANVCNYTATLSVTIPGVPYPTSYRPYNPPPGGCSVTRATVSFPSYKSRRVPSGTTFCTRFFENQQQQGKTTCVTLK